MEKLVTAKNGGLYEVVDAKNKKVKKVKPIDGFVQNDTLDSLETDIEYGNTECLYKLLRAELGEDVQWSKRGFIKYKGFKIMYLSHGFRIEDTLNFGEVVNVNNFHNDLAYPADVLEWLRKNSERTIKPPKRDEEKVKIISALSEKFIVTVGGKTQVTEKPREQVLKDKADKKAAIIKSTRESRITNAADKFKAAFRDNAKIAELHKLSMKISQNKEFLKAIKSAIYQVKRGKITDKAFMKQFVELVTPLKNKKPVVVAVRPPKFQGLEILWEPVNPKFGNRMVKDPTNPEVTVSVPTMSFTQKDASGKKGYSIETTIPAYLAHVVLYYFPKAMPLVMKVCKGEKFNYRELDLDKFVKDPMEPFCVDLLLKPEIQYELQVCCEEILWYYGQTTALDYVFTSECKKGDKVRVFWPDNHVWYEGEVTGIDSGVRIRYEDGEVSHLLKHQKIEKL